MNCGLKVVPFYTLPSGFAFRIPCWCLQGSKNVCHHAHTACALLHAPTVSILPLLYPHCPTVSHYPSVLQQVPCSGPCSHFAASMTSTFASCWPWLPSGLHWTRLLGHLTSEALYLHRQVTDKMFVIQCLKGVLKPKTVKSEIILPVKELVLIDKYTPSFRFWSLSLFCLCSLK